MRVGVRFLDHPTDEQSLFSVGRRHNRWHNLPSPVLGLLLLLLTVVSPLVTFVNAQTSVV